MIKPSAIFIAGYLAITLFICVGVLIFYYPWHPSTVLGWSLFLMIIPPLYLFGEFIGSKIMSEKISEKIESTKKTPKVSAPRMVYILFIMTSFVFIALLIQYLLNHSISDFMKHNFSNKW